MDLLLTSIRTSGRRTYGPELRFDQVERKLSTTVPFGSKQNDAFDEAEHYFVVDSEMAPLNKFALSCHQGVNSDASFRCRPIEISNIVCGHYGVFFFSITRI